MIDHALKIEKENFSNEEEKVEENKFSEIRDQ
jgi:hypothetical protein